MPSLFVATVCSTRVAIFRNAISARGTGRSEGSITTPVNVLLESAWTNDTERNSSMQPRIVQNVGICLMMQRARALNPINDAVDQGTIHFLDSCIESRTDKLPLPLAAL